MKSSSFGPSFRCLWFWTVQDTTQPEELLAGFTGLESSGSGTGLTSPAAPWDFCTKINTLQLYSSQYATFTFSIMHLICPPPPPIFHNLCFSFLLGITVVPREIEKSAYAKFWGANKVHYRKCGSKWHIPKPPFSPKFPARHVGILDGQTPHRLALQKASYPPSTSDYSKIFSLVKPFIQMYVNTQLKTTEISYEILESCFMRRFVRFNKIVHSSKSTFNGVFKGSQMLQQTNIHVGAMTREHGVHALSCFFFLATLTSVLSRKSNARLVGPHFGSNSPLHGAKLQSSARGMLGFGIDWKTS